MGTIGDLTGAVQTILLVIVIGIIGAGAIWLRNYFKSAEEKTKDSLSEDDKQRYDDSDAFTKAAVVTDETLTGGSIRDYGKDTAQAEYEKYAEICPELGQAYNELSGGGRTLVSLGDKLTFGYSSKAGYATGELLKKYNFWK